MYFENTYFPTLSNALIDSGSLFRSYPRCTSDKSKQGTELEATTFPVPGIAEKNLLEQLFLWGIGR